MTQWDPGGEKQWAQQIPPQIFVPVVLVAKATEALNPKPNQQIDPMELGAEAGVRKIEAQIKSIIKDSKMIEGLRGAGGGEGPPPEEGGPPPEGEAMKPGEYDEDDEAVMQGAAY